MRYVMMLFHCSIKGCENRAESLIPVRLTYQMTSQIRIGGGQTVPRVLAISQALPDGWGSATSAARDLINDRDDTYCPEHKKDEKSEVKRGR